MEFMGNPLKGALSLAIAGAAIAGCTTAAPLVRSSWRETPPTSLAPAAALSRIKKALADELGLSVAGEDRDMFWTDAAQVSWRELGGPLDVPLPVRLVFVEDRTSPFSAFYKLELATGSGTVLVQRNTKEIALLANAYQGIFGRRVMLVLSDALGQVSHGGARPSQMRAARNSPPADPKPPRKAKMRKSKETTRRIGNTR